MPHEAPDRSHQPLYAGIILLKGWREVVPTNETHWADEDPEYGEFFGVPVGGLIEGP